MPVAACNLFKYLQVGSISEIGHCLNHVTRHIKELSIGENHFELHKKFYHEIHTKQISVYIPNKNQDIIQKHTNTCLFWNDGLEALPQKK